ncbi:major capsid protein [Devosia sp. A8/3-2]|nr:major capsid protein [Devosia sp. A8/3-2]
MTRLSDVIQPEVFMNYMDTYTKENSAFFESGVFRSDPNLASFLSGGGRTVNIPFWKDLPGDDSEPGDDDPNSVLIPKKITAGKDVGVRQVRSQSRQSSSLTADLAGADPMQAIARRVGKYWVREFDKIAWATAYGVYLDNVANDGGDMVSDIGGDDGTVIASELISAEAILDAKQTMGDAAEDLKVIVMHSVVYTRLQKQNLIDFIPDARGEVRFPTYLGYRVVITDRAKTIVGANPADVEYLTLLLGENAFAFTEAPLATSPMIEVDRKPEQGNGVGVDILYSRRQFIMHPYGIKWTDASVGGEFPTNAELGLAVNWDRVYPERKQIPIAFLVTNG